MRALPSGLAMNFPWRGAVTMMTVRSSPSGSLAFSRRLSRIGGALVEPETQVGGDRGLVVGPLRGWIVLGETHGIGGGDSGVTMPGVGFVPVAEVGEIVVDCVPGDVRPGNRYRK